MASRLPSDSMVATGEGSLRIPITKRDDEKRQVFGFAAVVEKADGTPIVDHQGDIIPVDELRRMAHEAVSMGGRARAGVNHNPEIGRRGDIIESVIIDKAFREAIGAEPGPTSWWVGMQINRDDDWARVKSGELSELSIKFMGRRTPTDG